MGSRDAGQVSTLSARRWWSCGILATVDLGDLIPPARPTWVVDPVVV